MKLLESLKRHPADNCVILTYNADLMFFEYMLFEPLYGAGCRNTLVICDPVQYQKALGDASHLRFAGQRYWLLPGFTSPTGAFHPKLILLTSADRGRLFLASGNLTKAGYTHNWEVVTLFEYQVKKPDILAWRACEWAVDTIRQIVQDSGESNFAGERLEQLVGTTPWLHSEPTVGGVDHVWWLHNLGRSLLDQVYDQYRQLDASPVLEALVVSPYFDSGARAVTEVGRRFQPQRWRILTQSDGHGLSPRALIAAVDPSNVPLEMNGLDLNGRTLHAKTLRLRTERGTWLMTGSANFSAPALLYPASEGNTEVVSLRYELDPAYFDPWLAELIRHGAPIVVESMPEPAAVDRPLGTIQRQIRLVGATLEKSELRLQLVERLVPETKVSLNLHQDTVKSLSLRNWEQDSDLVIAVPMGLERLSELQRPTLVCIEVIINGETYHSNLSLLHNVDALQRFGRPVIRRERPRIPDGLQPEDDEHAIQLMDMLNELLATNSELVRRHQGRIAASAEQDQQETQMALEDAEDYDPQAHFVGELVRTRAVGPGASLYANYFDRLTYEDLLRAVLSAVRPLVQPLTESGSSSSSPDHPERRQTDSPPPDDAAIRAKTVERIQRGFQRLVGSFQQGVGDSDYLAKVPPRYLAELYVIITAYLREVWRQGILPRDHFVEHSLTMFESFWGYVGIPGAWKVMRSRLGEAEIQAEERRLVLSARSWFHVFVVAQLLEQANAPKLYRLAAWMRHVASRFSPPEVLHDLDESVYQQLQRFGLPVDWPRRDAGEIVRYLKNIMPRYNEITLLEEIAAWPGTRVTVKTEKIAGLPQVRILEVKTPFSPDTLDEYVKAFATFVAWPNPKPAAWARFTNTNPPLSSDDVGSVRIFYRSDERWLLFATQYASGEFYEIERLSVDINDLVGVTSLAQLNAL